MRADPRLMTQTTNTGRPLNVGALVCLLDQLSARAVAAADGPTLRRLNELVFDCGLLAAAELERRLQQARRGTTEPLSQSAGFVPLPCADILRGQAQRSGDGIHVAQKCF